MTGVRCNVGTGALKRSIAILAGALVACAGAAGGATVRKLQTPPEITAMTRIPVEALGFEPPNRAWVTYRVPSATLDFIDDKHLLFTFHKMTLMRREEQEPDDDEDQTISALVLELPDGKVVQQANWRMHDKGRYLWAIGQGRFLERERNTLFLINKSLNERTPYFTADGKLTAVELSPDASQLIVEYQEEVPVEASGDGAQKAAPTLGPDAPPAARRHRVKLLVISTQTSKVEKTATLPQAVALSLIGGGYMGVQPDKGKLWNILVTPFGEKSRQVTQLSSSCEPQLHTISERVFLAELCIPYSTDRLMQAYTLSGQKLWEQQWESRYVWGNFDLAENGSRFAYESIQLDHAMASLDPIDETSITGQPIGVYDVADGTLRMVSGAEPVLSAGQNYALSPDGERFAVLRKGSIEVYRLPPASVR